MALPRVSVLMSVYNDERHVRETIDSVLAQSFVDFEFLILDDGSTDGTASLLDSYIDPRIVRIQNATNIGLTRSLNRGLEEARGEYVARIDGDDIMEPGRLAAQVAYLDAHPEIDVLGTWFRCFDEQGMLVGEWEIAPNPMVIAWLMGWHCAIGHPTVLMRREAILALGGYDPARLYAQDYDLWTRVIMAGSKVSVLPEQATRLRILPGNISSAKKGQQRQCAIDIAHRYAEWRLDTPVAKEHIAAIFALFTAGEMNAETRLVSALSLLRRIQRRWERECDPVSARLIRRLASDKLMGLALANSYNRPALSCALLADIVRNDPVQILRGQTWKQIARLTVAPRSKRAQWAQGGSMP